MADTYRITLAQLNPTTGDLAGNAALARSAHDQARAAGADLVALPELFLTGYQVQDLVVKPAFLDDVDHHLEALAQACADGPAIAIGAPWRKDGKLFNAYHILDGGRVAASTAKHFLPNTHVFDERRVFDHGPIPGPVNVRGVRLSLPICEDAWHEDVCEAGAESGAEIFLVPNGSPYFRGKQDQRVANMVARTVENRLPLVYLNMVGGQDDQVFDGSSFVLNTGGALAAQMPAFDDALAHVDFTRTAQGWVADDSDKADLPDAMEADYRAMVQGLRDYLRKSGIDRVLLGLSGGIDSALVAAIAADAIGGQNVRCVMLPSEYTSQASLDDARAVADNLGCTLDSMPISGPRAAVTGALAPLFGGTEPGVAEENIQSRLRGLLLMALSNKFGGMLLTTGNKSEVAVGYATIYGDMAGGYNPIKDLYKTRVSAMCRWRNDQHRDWMMGPVGVVIPPRVIDKPPSAELREDQKDEDSLPPYEVLDGILEMLVDRDASVADCVAAGFDRATVKRVEALLYGAEWKRFQSAPGVRLSQKAFWLDRRYPIVNRWRDGGGDAG